MDAPAEGNRFSNRNHRRKRLGVNELRSALSAAVTSRTARSVEFRLAGAGSTGPSCSRFRNGRLVAAYHLPHVPHMSMTGGRSPSVFLATPFRETYGVFSPDGRWVAYQSNESGRIEVYVRPQFVAATAVTPPVAASRQWQVSTAGGLYPVWRPDGKELYYINPAGAMTAVPITITGAVLNPGAPVGLFRKRIYGGGEDIQDGQPYDVAPDGRFLINTLLESAAAPITLIQHWNPDAKK